MGWNQVGENEVSGGVAITPAYATMAITKSDVSDTNPQNTIAVVAHPGGTDVLNPPASLPSGSTSGGGYYKVGGWALEGESKGFTFASDALITTNGGLFHIPVGWGGFRHSQNGATTAFVLGIDDGVSVNFSPRPTSEKQANLNDLSNVSGGGQTRLGAGNSLSVWVASDATGTITLGNANVTISKIDN